MDSKLDLKTILDLHSKWLGSDPNGSLANLVGADLGGAYLGGADLGGAYLTRASLGGAYLAGAYLAGANLGGATANEWTRWPDQFDPTDRGVTIR